MNKFEITPIPERWRCSICGMATITKEEIEACHARIPEPAYEVGEFVELQLGYGWHGESPKNGIINVDTDPNPDNPWVLGKDGYEFNDEPTFRFLGVITHVCTRPPHSPGKCPNIPEWEYTVLTRAIRFEENDGSVRWKGGWNIPATHRLMGKMNQSTVPEQCRNDVKRDRVLGHHSKYLL